MRRLIYASRWTQGVREDAHHALQVIVARAIRNNRANELTGFLISHAGWFLQVIEGPDRAVTEAIARMAADDRHTDIKVLADSEITARDFSRTAMAGAACWAPEVATAFESAAVNGFADTSESQLLDLLRAVSRSDIGRVPCAVAA